mgnify:CR=1 FL=1
MNIQQLAEQFESNWKLFRKFSQAAIVTCMAISTLLYVNQGQEPGQAKVRSAEQVTLTGTPFALPYRADTPPPDEPASWLFENGALQTLATPACSAAAPLVMLAVPEHLERVPYLRMVAQETREIEALLGDGRLVWPQNSNALERLRKLLDKFPGYPGVAELHDRSVAMLITVATDLFEQGYRFEARNLLEEALTVAPDDRRARTLHERFTKAMQEQPGSRVFDLSAWDSTSG